MKYISLTPEQVWHFPDQGLHLIEASAGTGKTYTISNLYLKYICEGHEVGNILVVTFTKAATDELRGRLRNRLYETLAYLKDNVHTEDEFLVLIKTQYKASGDIELAINRLQLAVRSMDEASIYTIHGFCQKTLAEFAFESRQQFQQTIITNDSEYWEQAIQDWWRNTFYPLDYTDLQLYQSSLGNIESFQVLLRPLLGAEKKKLIPTPKSLTDIGKAMQTVKSGLLELALEWTRSGEEIKAILLSSTGLSRTQANHYKKDKLELLLNRINDYFSACSKPETLAFPVDEFKLLTRGYIDKNKLKKADEKLEHVFFEQCQSLWTLFIELKAELRRWAIADAEKFARKRVAKIKLQTQSLSFDDLLTSLNNAISSSSSLAALINARYPIALIDEFQDTDPVQYSIFEQIYQYRDKSCLVLIGDPKQAIYSFRGGDIFTYMKAKQAIDGDSIYTLNTNWRSSGSVIKAVNTIFEYRKKSSFVYDSIPYLPLKPAAQEIKPDVDLVRHNNQQAALTLWKIPLTESKGKLTPMSKEAAEKAIHLSIAAEVAKLIAEGQEKTALLGSQAVKPGDIAILVRNAYQARDLRQILKRYNINAVAIDRNNVFASEEAQGLLVLLKAILEPQNRDLARQALSSSILGLSISTMNEIVNNELQWLGWLESLATLHDYWQRKGFMAMFQSMLKVMGQFDGTASKTKPHTNRQRQFTNILHLGELLQQASKSHPGIESLVSWYQKQTEAVQTEESLLRLESDDELVQIVTVHSSKGLEYPIVFVPYLWSCKPRDKKGLLSFHDKSEHIVDAGSGNIDKHHRLAEKERLAEDIRLAYVGLTRAKSAIYLVWGNAGSREGKSSHTALAYLLHPRQDVLELNTTLPQAYDNGDDLENDYKNLEELSDNTICVTDLLMANADQVPVIEQIEYDIKVNTKKRDVACDWRISSFSAITRHIHAPAVQRYLEQEEKHIAFQFPRGSEMGTFLHLMFEKIDFTENVPEQVLLLADTLMPRFNLERELWANSLAYWLEDILQTSLDENGLSLGRLDNQYRLNEMEFDLSMEKLDFDKLNTLLANYFNRQVAPVVHESIQGILTGIIDLVFEYQGKYYIADYKSNHLGSELSYYTYEKLKDAVLGHRYDIQYLIYTLALHRYLKQRLADYDYMKHFGGVYYLFIRGMRSEHGHEFGVYKDLPPFSLIDALDKQVFLYEENTLGAGVSE